MLSLVELPAAPGARGPLAKGRDIWIAGGPSRLAAALATCLSSCGDRVRTISLDTANEFPDPGQIGGLVIVAPEPGGSGELLPRSSEAFLKRAFALAKHAAAALDAGTAASNAFLLTVTRLDGSFGLGGGREFDAVSGGLAGLSKTAAIEWPSVTCRALDIAPDLSEQDAAELIAAEVRCEGPVEVALAKGGRRGLQLAPQSVEPGKPVIARGDLVVVTGGARGVTAEVAVSLGALAQPTLLLLGRSEAPHGEPEWLAGLESDSDIKRAILNHQFGASVRPTPAQIEAACRRHRANREIARNLARLAATGARAAYRQADICSESDVRRIVEEARREFGPIRGIVHGAGVLEDRRIRDKTLAQFEHVFDTKVRGLRHVLDAVDADELRWLVLFSSVSARFGRQGQVDYAMANEVLNKAARQFAARHPDCRTVAINWGPWDGGMVSPGLKREFEKSGVSLIPKDAGANAFIEELCHAGPQRVEVVLGSGFPEQASPAEGFARAAVSGGVRKRSSQSLRPVFERVIRIEEHPILGSHLLEGRAVLPVALMVEWLAHAALHPNPGLQFGGIDDLRVLKGVVLGDSPVTIRVHAGNARRCDGGFEVGLELRSGAAGGELSHVRASVLLTDGAIAPPDPHCVAMDSRHWNGPPAAQAYREALFHGPALQCIEALSKCGPEGLAAKMRGAPAPREWMQSPPRPTWLAHPLILDGGLQMGLIWTHYQLGSPSLPTRVGRYRQYRPQFPADVTAVLEIERHSVYQVVGRISFFDGAEPVAVMDGCEWTADPGLRGAFSRNALTVSA